MIDYVTRCAVAVADARRLGLHGRALDDKVCLLLRTGSGRTRIERREDMFDGFYDVEVYANGADVPEWFGGVSVPKQ
jgi:hypothetical protein